MKGRLRVHSTECVQANEMSKNAKRVRRPFVDEFKQDAVGLVVEQSDSFPAAANAVSVPACRLWQCRGDARRDIAGQAAVV